MTNLTIGRLGPCDFAPGWYLYVGSAFGPGGLAARLAHHRRHDKPRPHWHIDYLRPYLHLVAIWSVAGGGRLEQPWCQHLVESPAFSVPVPGFGASDSPCVAHLLYTPDVPRLKTLSATLFATLAKAHSQPQNLHLDITLLPG